MSEDSIFMVNIKQYPSRSRWQRFLKTCFYCLFFMYKCFQDGKKIPNFTANAALRFFTETTLRQPINIYDKA